MRAHWYVVIVVLILAFIYLNSPSGTVTKTVPTALDIESYRLQNWSVITIEQTDAVTGQFQGRIFNYSQQRKTIGDIRLAKFVGRMYLDGRMRNVAVNVARGAFEGDFVGEVNGFDFSGNVSGRAISWAMQGYIEPEATPGTATPAPKQDMTYYILGAAALLILYTTYSKKGGIFKAMDDAMIDKKLRKFINDNYSKQVWQVLKHKSVPEDMPQWVKIHFTVFEPFGLDCITIFRIKEGRFTDTAFGVRPYEVEDFWERRISYEAAYNPPSFGRGPGRPPKEE